VFENQAADFGGETWKLRESDRAGREWRGLRSRDVGHKCCVSKNAKM
jgi:hypothetical protein